jgi:excisionase family DNA binding protein
MNKVNPGYLVGYAQLAEYIHGASKKTLRRWVRDGKIPYRRESHKLILFRIADVDRALQQPSSGLSGDGCGRGHQ